ncbi:MAG: CvpA family protein, partial [Bacilli bacterium]|nr:CvpA family protein [Bacilli bacterium]
MTINVDFDIIIVAIFVTIFITGFIRGGGIEFLRVAKIVIPFIILYFFGDKITNLLFSSPKIVQFVYYILTNVPYRNTIASLSTKILLYIVVYLFLAILLWRLGKYVLDERIEYYFGRYNSILGGIFALIRMYIIISIIIIPFYALNFTNQHDPLTKFIINHPPRFSRIGILLDKARPTVDKLNEVTSSLKIMDIKSLEKYTRLVYDVKDFVTDTEKEAYDLYNYLLEEKVITEDYNQREFLIYYLNNLTFFQELTLKNKEMHNLNKSLYDKVSTYKQVYIWAYEKHVLEMESEDEVIESFINNYNEIAASTNDELSIEMLTKLKFNVKLYLVLKEWLATSFDISISSTSDLLNDGNIENILDNYHLYENYLIELINNEFEPKEQELILS